MLLRLDQGLVYMLRHGSYQLTDMTAASTTNFTPHLNQELEMKQICTKEAQVEDGGNEMASPLGEMLA